MCVYIYTSISFQNKLLMYISIYTYTCIYTQELLCKINEDIQTSGKSKIEERQKPQ